MLVLVIAVQPEAPAFVQKPEPTPTILNIPKPPRVEENKDCDNSIKVMASAYTNNDFGMNGKGITASGTKTRPVTQPGPATLAVDPKIIPLGTELYIPYFKDYPCKGHFIAEDTGGAIKGYKVDINFANRKEALEFGRRELTVFVK